MKFQLHKCISALTKTCLEVCADISRQLVKDDPEDVNMESARMKILVRCTLFSLLRDSLGRKAFLTSCRT